VFSADAAVKNTALLWKIQHYFEKYSIVVKYIKL